MFNQLALYVQLLYASSVPGQPKQKFYVLVFQTNCRINAGEIRSYTPAQAPPAALVIYIRVCLLY